MYDTKLWWFRKNEDGSMNFVQKTYEEAMEDAISPLSSIVIVHPDNPIYPESLRAYNEAHRDVIDHIIVSRLKRLVDIDAPDIVIAGEGTSGILGYSCSVLTNWMEDTVVEEEEDA